MRRTLRRSPRRVGYCRRMLDASTRSGGTATASPRAVGTPDLALAVPVPAAPAPGPAARWARALLSPWSRLSLLVVVLLSAASVMVLFEPRSEEHTSELQSRENLVCRLLLEKKKNSRQR